MLWAGLLALIGLTATGVAITLVCPAPLFAIYAVEGTSMQPTLRCGAAPGCSALRSQRVLVSALPYLFSAPGRGDIVLVDLRHPSCGGHTVLVKRIVGVPGDVVSEFRGRVSLDGSPLFEPYVPVAEEDHDTFPPIKLGSARYFVMGDNRSFSCDSRSFGPIRRSDIRGKVIGDADFLP